MSAVKSSKKKVVGRSKTSSAKQRDLKSSVESGTRFLCRLAEALHVYGTSADRLEEALELCAKRLGLRGQFFAAPTSIQIAIETRNGAIARLIRVDQSELNLDKLDRVDGVMYDLIRGRIGPETGSQKIKEIQESKNRYSEVALIFGFAVSSALVAKLFGGGPLEVLVTTSTALVVGGVSSVVAQYERFRPLANVLAAAIASFLAFALIPSDEEAAYLVTVSSLILLMPGLKVTIAMRELAMQHLTAGTTRMVQALGHLLALALGVAMGKQIASTVALGMVMPFMPAFPEGSTMVAICLTPLSFLVGYQVKVRDLGVVAVGCFLAYFSARWGSLHMGSELGAFMGAAAVGVGANIFARTFGRSSSLMLIPGVTLLVPGSVGFRSVLALLDHDALSGIEAGFAMVLVGTALGSGLIVANIFVPPNPTDS